MELPFEASFEPKSQWRMESTCADWQPTPRAEFFFLAQREFCINKSDRGRSSEAGEKEKVTDGERAGTVRVRDRERMGERAKHPLMFVGWSGLLFRTQAGMVNIGGFSNQRLWSQPCCEMMLMTQWCQNTKEWPLHTDTHVLLYAEILASTVHKYTPTCFHSSTVSFNLSFKLLNSWISIFLSLWCVHTIP